MTPKGTDDAGDAQSPSDGELDAVVANLQQSIRGWATRHELWLDCGFQSYAERVDGEPGITPVVTILHFDGDLGRALDGELDGLDMEFFELLERHGFWYERNDAVSAHIPRMRAHWSSRSWTKPTGNGYAAWSSRTWPTSTRSCTRTSLNARRISIA